MSRTKIAYFDPLGVYPEVQDEIKSKLPLVNLHWNPPSRPLRSIPSLDVDLVEETAVHEVAPKHQMLGLSSAPYLKIIFVACEDSETYKNSVRKMIREWLTNSVNATRDPTEWLIIHYVRPGAKPVSGNRFKTSVYDKVRADFNSGSKKDRCVQLRKEYSSELEYMEAWSDIMTRIKEGVLEAFGRRVDLYEDEVAKLEAKKTVMGWNFGTFFYMKEGLALSFENISLFEDALMLYDELESAFSTALKQKNATFFASVGFDFDKPPRTPLELQNDPEMRRQIMSNEISLFDFYCYLFGRQAYLLLMISKVSSSPSISALKIGELFLRVRSFITEMSGLQQSNRKHPLVAAEWAYDVVKEILRETEHVKDGLAIEVAEGRGELQLLCRKSLEVLAAVKGWKIEGPLADVSLDEEHDEHNIKEYQILNEELVRNLESKDLFFGEYRSETKVAAAQFELADRIRTVNRLSAQLALLDFQLGNYDSACKQLESIPALYNRQGWDLVSTSLLSVFVQCLEKLGRKSDILLYSLELIRDYKYLSPGEIKSCVSNIHQLSDQVELKSSMEDFFGVNVIPFMDNSGSNPYSHSLAVEFSSLVGQSFEFEHGYLTLVDSKANSAEKLVLSAESPSIKGTGKQKIMFSSKKFVKGTFKVDSLTLMQRKLTFVKSFDTPLVVELFPSPGHLSVDLRLPKYYNLAERKFNLVISAPTELKTCTAWFKGLTTGARIITSRVQADTGSAEEVKPSTVSVGSVSGRRTLFIPYTSEADITSVSVKCVLEFTTEDGEKYQYVTVEDVFVSLPIDVSVHDFFKTARLFSKFSISCRSASQPVRLLKSTLGESDDYSVRGLLSARQGGYVAFPGGPVSFVYSITHKGDSPSSGKPLALKLLHRYISDEVYVVLWNRLFSSLDEDLKAFEYIIKPIVKSIPVDLRSAALERKIIPNVNELETILKTSNALDNIPVSNQKRIIEIIRALTMEPFDMPTITSLQDAYEDITHELEIPVSIPRVDIVHGIELCLPKTSHYVIGQTLPVTMIIDSDMRWSSTQTGEEHWFAYDLLIQQDTWAMTGKKRAKFSVTKESGRTEIEFALIPLRTGKLNLPQVEISTTDTEIKIEIENRNGCETALVVPEFDRITKVW
ncbi:trafficking protein particle complex II-specific subunit 130 [Trichomonascus vanleenenianus]|uniref:transport protein particle complex II subunit TRS130 n=1 Tax=Trichomonascus vanleenenianus TaxID=2268995 RepID=UPI003ECAE401